MKNIVKSLAILSLFAGLVSCEGEDNLMFSSPEGAFQILSPNTGEGVVLDPATPSNPGLSLTWEDISYGTPTQVTYTVEIDKSGDNFDTPLVLTSTTNTFATITSEALNAAAVGAGLTPFTQEGLEIRIKSSIGTTGSEPAYSNVVTYLVTTYSTDLPRMYVTGNFGAASGYNNDWTPSAGVPLAASAFGATNFEGYVYMNVAAPEFKILPTNVSWDGDYGDDGSFSGTLLQEGESNILLSAAGYYLIKADTDLLTYSATPTTWGIIGAATPGSWNSSTPLTYNPTTKVWEGDMALTAGEFKFRANDAWAINLGGYDASKPNTGDQMSYDGPNLVTEAGNFHVVLDLSNPRAYTYTLTAN